MTKYWLCCGSIDEFHEDERAKGCIETMHPERQRFGTADEHGKWQKKRKSSIDMINQQFADHNKIVGEMKAAYYERLDRKYRWMLYLSIPFIILQIICFIFF
jgi:hypothetical protein